MMSSPMNRTFVGFGFGAIQSGLFLNEAHRTGLFDRLVVAEVMPDVVNALRQNGGRYHLNIATRTGLETRLVDNIELLNPCDPGDRIQLVTAVQEATEMATALPSVDFFDRGDASIAAILAEGLSAKLRKPAGPRCVLYAGENHNHAAELLDAAVCRKLSGADSHRLSDVFQPLNTVIGKMSKIVTDPVEMAAQDLVPLAPTLERAVLVEEFNHILVSRAVEGPPSHSVGL